MGLGRYLGLIGATTFVGLRLGGLMGRDALASCTIVNIGTHFHNHMPVIHIIVISLMRENIILIA